MNPKYNVHTQTNLSRSPVSRLFIAAEIKGECYEKRYNYKNRSINENGFYEVELTAVRENFADMKPTDLNEAYIQTGMNSINEIVSTFMTGVESVYSQIADGDLIFLDNESLIDPEDDKYYLQGGSTYDITHWWGRSRYKSTYCWYLASDVSYYNSLSSRGIVADITWVYTYKMRTQ